MSYSPQDLPNLRQVVDPTLAGLPTVRLRTSVDAALGEGFADSMDEDLEGVFDNIGHALSSAARDVGHFASRNAGGIAQIGGGVLQGAMAGSAAGLPGIIAGAATGGVGAGLSRYGSGSVRRAGDALTGVTRLAGQFSPMGQAGGAIGGMVSGLGTPNRRGPGSLGGGSGALSQIGSLLGSPQVAGALGGLFGGGGAAGQLTAAIRNPDVQKALAALRMGDLGRSSIPIGPRQQPVPTAAFADLLSHLAQQAGLGIAPRTGESEDESVAFMADGEGGFAGDPASPQDRAARLWSMLNEGMVERVIEAVEEEFADDEDETFEDDEAAYYDALDLAEAEDIDYALETEPGHEW